MGSIRKARNKHENEWEIDYIDPFTGKRRRKLFKGTIRETEYICMELELKRYRILNGLETPVRTNMQLSDLIEQYLHTIGVAKNPKTVKREKLTLSDFSQYLGNRILGSIRPLDIQYYVEYRLKKGLSPNTVNLDIRNLKIFFNYGIKNYFLEMNPMRGVKGPKPREKKVRFLTEKEIHDLLEVIDNSLFRDLIITYLNTGARRQELLPPLFTWDCIDYNLMQIRVTGKYDKVRYIPMNCSVHDILIEHKKQGLNYPFEFKPEYVSHKLAKYYKIAGIPNANVHVLRKTFGSLLIQKKLADIYEVSKLLGHSSVKVTESHYVDLLKEDIEKPVQKLAGIIQPK